MANLKYQVGDVLVVLGDWEHTNHPFPIGTIVTVIRTGTEQLDVCDNSTGDIWWVNGKDLKPYNKNKTEMKAMKDAVLTVAKQLAKANNTVTTLEIKTELRRDYPYYFWTQQVVSDYMSQFAGDGIFTYTDNGTFRTYSLASASSVASTAGPVSKSVSGTITNFSKVAGTTPSKRSTPKRRIPSTPRRKSNGLMSRSMLTTYVASGNFDNVVLNGQTITPSVIKSQKKSPQGYFTTSKINKVTQATIGGQTFLVK